LRVVVSWLLSVLCREFPACLAVSVARVGGVSAVVAVPEPRGDRSPAGATGASKTREAHRGVLSGATRWWPALGLERLSRTWGTSWDVLALST
jgi:hypothetical protein